MPLDERDIFVAARDWSLAAGALIRDAEDRILIVRLSYQKTWDIPGGVVRFGESPAAAVQREVVEELGLRVSCGPLLCVDSVTCAEQPGGLRLIFDCGRLGDDAVIQPDRVEVLSAVFAGRAEMEERLAPPLLRRIEGGIGKRGSYLEDGWAVEDPPLRGTP